MYNGHLDETLFPAIRNQLLLLSGSAASKWFCAEEDGRVYVSLKVEGFVAISTGFPCIVLYCRVIREDTDLCCVTAVLVGGVHRHSIEGQGGPERLGRKDTH